jgi:hypothetical protein
MKVDINTVGAKSRFCLGYLCVYPRLDLTRIPRRRSTRRENCLVAWNCTSMLIRGALFAEARIDVWAAPRAWLHPTQAAQFPCTLRPARCAQALDPCGAQLDRRWPVAVAWQSRGVGPRPAGVLYKVATSRRLSRPLNRTCSRQIDWPRACMEGCLAGTKHDDNPGPNS